MMPGKSVLLFESDPAVLASLQFALPLQGFDPQDGAAQGADPSSAMCLVIDERYRGGGLRFLKELRSAGAARPAILLATNPSSRLRHDAVAAGIVLVEKPLLGEELTQALAAFTCN